MAFKGRNRKGDTEDKPLGGPVDKDNKWTFKVRCSSEFAHFLYVQAPTEDEAIRMAERHCRKGYSNDDSFWESEASHIHSKFEAEEV